MSDCYPMDSIVHGISLEQNTGVGSLSLLQGIFPTQELNQGPLHCRRILYQLSYQGRTTSSDGLYIGLTSRNSWKSYQNGKS